MTEDIKAFSRRFIEEVWNDRRLDLIPELVSEDHVDHDPAQAGLPSGPAGMRAFVETYLAAFPDVRFTIEDVICEEDRVTIRWTATGTHQGPLPGIAPSGKRVSITGILIDRIADGKIVETWSNWDALGLFRQLGAAPARS
jgi:steroid delta-isomerase-like uncharacterized protein